jgi:hypothetical protein
MRGNRNASIRNGILETNILGWAKHYETKVCSSRQGETSMTLGTLGKSELTVLAWLKRHPASKAQEVGDALYDTTSGCAKQPADVTITPRKRLRASWASKVLQRLKKRGLANIDDYNDPKWSVTKAKKT